MATKVWESIKVRYCEHAEDEVSLEAQVVYPSEWLPEQPPQVVSHRCSHAFACNLDNRPSCIWAGTFKESEKEK
jgi:hypothetical protein